MNAIFLRQLLKNTRLHTVPRHKSNVRLYAGNATAPKTFGARKCRAKSLSILPAAMEHVRSVSQRIAREISATGLALAHGVDLVSQRQVYAPDSIDVNARFACGSKN